MQCEMKVVYVILAFHAHEPLWELPQQVLENVDDLDLKLTLESENWIVRRSAEGRDIYTELLRFARDMELPVTLEASNELLMQLAKIMPDTLAELRKAYQDGTIYPLYGHAHHTHVCLLTEEELEDEIRLNKEYLHDVLSVPYPRYAGLFPTENSLDSFKLQAIKRSGIDYVIFPNLDRQRDRYRVEGVLKQPYEPFLIGPGLIALPRHFPVSQYIWRPITKWKHEGVRNQGYLLGRYWVLPEEYRKRRFVRFPITREEAVEEYRRVLRRALKQAPDRGLILYIQDLELMDFGDVALDVMEGAWRAVLSERVAQVRFVTPDQYLEERVIPSQSKLSKLRFHQVSWAPEIRLVLRYDGHYPPLGAGNFRGVDLTREVFRRWPFIFWEPGRYLAMLCNWLTDSFGFSSRVPLTAMQLQEKEYHFETLSVPARVALHLRIIKRACNWGWFPNEGLQKRPFLHGYCLADILMTQVNNQEAHPGKSLKPIDPLWFRGLERLPEVILDTRHGYLAEALGKLSLRLDKDYSEAWRELERSRQWRDQAQRSILMALEHARKLNEPKATDLPKELHGLLYELRGYCRAMFISLDHLQRTWSKAGDTDTVLVTMYEYLYELYPPKFPSILMSTAGGEGEDN
jgi:hypothetical protein